MRVVRIAGNRLRAGRIGTHIRLLASDLASYVTGEVYGVTG